MTNILLLDCKTPESGAYDALYDPETGLWTQGPDYFTDFFLRMKENV